MTQKKDSTVLWWIGWIILTIASFFVSAYFWTHFIARHVGPMSQPGVPVLWVATVFGGWMVLLLPLIILMYNKVDRAYEDTRIARENIAFDKAKADFKVRSVTIDPAKRLLSKPLKNKLKIISPAVKRGHLVTVILKSGRKVPHVFILGGEDVLGIYGAQRLDFDIQEIVDFQATDLDHLPEFKTEEWLRLDGVGGVQETGN